MDEGQHTKIRCISTRERIRENLSASFTMTSARIGCPGSSRTKDGRESVLSVHVADRQTYTVREQDSAFRTRMLPREIYHHTQNPRRFFFCLFENSFLFVWNPTGPGLIRQVLKESHVGERAEGQTRRPRAQSGVDCTGPRAATWAGRRSGQLAPRP